MRSAGKRGRKPSQTTLQLLDDGQGVEVDNGVVLDHIIDIKTNPETDYGYKAITAALMLLGYIIIVYISRLLIVWGHILSANEHDLYLPHPLKFVSPFNHNLVLTNLDNDS